MFGTGVPSITKEVTTLKTFFAESPPLVWGIFGPIFVHVNLFLENHSVFFHKILHIIFWYFLWELINQKNMYGMSLFLWANLGILGAFCVCLPIYLDLVNIFLWNFGQIFLRTLPVTIRKNIMACYFALETFFCFFGPVLGMVLYILWKSQYFLMLFCTESLFITLAITNQEKISCWITLCLGHFGKVLGLFRSIKY